VSYQSLYRRYRPRRFAEVRGQEHVKSALISAIRNGTVGHAYLFSGPRGTGKTTSARLLAKALNCIDLQEGEPCGVCESCVSMDAGRSYDLFELDAASNNGVEAMRDLIAKAAVGSPGATKVYILDEVHMLSTAASNALLKTLEEPPDHVKFVLATTDPQKVLPTIKSRTQHFSFELLNAAELEEYVRWILADQGRELSDEAVAHVVRLGRGSARDTVSALEQVLATGGVITAAATVDEVLDAIASEDVGAALSAVDQAIAGGRDPRVLAETIVAGLRDVFLASMGSVGAHLPPADLAKVEAWAGTLRPARCARALELLGHAIVEMRQAAEPRIPLEVAVIRLSQPSMDTSVDALLDRVERLEARLADAGPVSAGATSAGPVASAEASEVAESADRPTGSPAATTRPQPPTATRVPAQERPPSAQPPSGQPLHLLHRQPLHLLHRPAHPPHRPMEIRPVRPAPRRSNVGWRL
jgi:DNA polymerase-3 subunit gamma/tau